MLTKVTIRNFKRFDEVSFELGSPVVLVGPNNSGKTSALQALALWDAGLQRWNEKRLGKRMPKKRSGVTINRRDLVTAPVPKANLFWSQLQTRKIHRTDGGQTTENIRIEIVVEGTTADGAWECGMEFDYANAESFYCRPLRVAGDEAQERMRVPDEAGKEKIVFLPPMSGLATNEVRLDEGAINARIGEGRTAEVLRNLCHVVCQDSNNNKWETLTKRIKDLFGVELDQPEYIAERGEIAMSYREHRGVRLDISSSGRGLQQTLLLLAYLYANQGAVLMVDEPDAHLEILRQRQTYQLLVDAARENGNQIIVASHSAVLLNEAAGNDVVVAFVGKPHRIDGRASHVHKALAAIGYEDYYLAEQTGWVLYLEGSTDLAILRAFAEKLEFKEAAQALERPFVKYVGNQPKDAISHFHGLKEALPSLCGAALFDQLESSPRERLGESAIMTWTRREIENYISSQESLEAYACAPMPEIDVAPLFAEVEKEKRRSAMKESIAEIAAALQKLGHGSPWSDDIKASDGFLIPLFKSYFKKLELPNLMEKKSFHTLAEHVPRDQLDPEIKENLEVIANVAKQARPMREDG